MVSGDLDPYYLTLKCYCELHLLYGQPVNKFDLSASFLYCYLTCWTNNKTRDKNTHMEHELDSRAVNGNNKIRTPHRVGRLGLHRRLAQS